MTAWPQHVIAIGPEMMSMGLSLASMATAETAPEIRDSLIGLRSSAQELSDIFGLADYAAVGSNKEYLSVVTGLNPRDIRDALEHLGNIEKCMIESRPRVLRLLYRQKFKEFFDGADLPFSQTDLAALLGDLFQKHLPALREARLSLILEVDRRARAEGFEVVPDDIDGFQG